MGQVNLFRGLPSSGASREGVSMHLRGPGRGLWNPSERGEEGAHVDREPKPASLGRPSRAVAVVAGCVRSRLAKAHLEYVFFRPRT